MSITVQGYPVTVYRGGMKVPPWEVIAAILIAAVSLAIAVVALRTARGLRTGPRRHSHDPQAEVFAFIINPSKPSSAGVRDQIVSAFAARKLKDPLFFETTERDPGVGQARDALQAGATVVVAAGGDGTVRAVAEVLAGTSHVMGLLPLGTGNLLARNIDIDVGNLSAALDTLLSGETRRIDVGRLQIERTARNSESFAGEDDLEEVDHADGVDAGATDDPPADDSADEGSTHIFLVIGGVGFDAAMIADTNSDLKDKVGWIAYFMAGVRHLHSQRTVLRISIDDREPAVMTLRTLLVGNCGKLPGGLTLLPDAKIDDGVLDIAALDARVGVMGWAQLFGEVVLQGLGVRNDQAYKIGRIDHTTGKQVTIEVTQGNQQVQVDGDVLGRAEQIKVWVEPGALIVRAPAA